MQLLSELPWWIPAALVLLGVLLAWTGHSSGEARLKLSGLGAIGLAVLLALTSWLLESDREKVVKRTRALVAAVEGRDKPGMLKLLHPKVTALAFTDRQQLVESAMSLADLGGLQTARVMSVNAQERDGDYMVTMRVTTAFGSGVQMTDWELEWRKTPEAGWVLRKATFGGGPGISDFRLDEQVRKMIK